LAPVLAGWCSPESCISTGSKSPFMPEAWLTEAGQTVSARVTALFESWAPSLRALIANSDEPPIVRSIYALPASHTRSRTPGVTLVGDAAHLMSPFAGEGANLAMLDGVELARILVSKPGNREAALALFEQDLFTRSHPIARRSADNLMRFFGPEAPMSVVELFTRQ
jgi:2-polyprenyl-6-methoxyphenol hydroxylase-like FAD-dependent oxidoreductase